ncbi:MAG: hypothetical protein ACK5SP_02320 [bacterium]
MGVEHDVQLTKKLFTTNRDMGFERSVDDVKKNYDVDALTAFFLLTEDSFLLLQEDGGRLVESYG